MGQAAISCTDRKPPGSCRGAPSDTLPMVSHFGGDNKKNTYKVRTWVKRHCVARQVLRAGVTWAIRRSSSCKYLNHGRNRWLVYRVLSERRSSSEVEGL
jgi:hypothetical protein